VDPHSADAGVCGDVGRCAHWQHSLSDTSIIEQTLKIC
jgi:hypothetical protein